jgi:hypothetical protein
MGIRRNAHFRMEECNANADIRIRRRHPRASCFDLRECISRNPEKMIVSANFHKRAAFTPKLKIMEQVAAVREVPAPYCLPSGPR